jgi:cell division protein FtsB
MATNSTDSKDKPINLYFGGLPKSGILEGSDNNAGSLKFIILQNDQLHSEIEKMKERVKELEDEVAELEAFNDSLEKTRNCLRGYIKNEHDSAKTYRKLYKNASAMFNRQFADCFYLFINIMSCLVINESYVIYPITLGIFGLIYLDYRVNIIKYNENKEGLKRIKDTEKADDYLDDLIDGM